MSGSDKKAGSSCEDCVFYDYDDIYDTYYCRVNLDEDEWLQALSGGRRVCPYYRHYDEYKSVHKQI